LFVVARDQFSIIASAAKKLKDIKKPSEDPRPFICSGLARTNLGIRLRAIDETSLTSEDPEEHLFRRRRDPQAPYRCRRSRTQSRMDDIYKAESLIALLYSGEQLRHEIDAHLQELADQAKSDALKREYQERLKPVDGSNSGADDSTLRLFLLRVLEAVHCHAKEEQLAGPIRLQATNRILKCLLLSFFLLVIPNLLLNFDSITAPSNFWSLFALYTALSAGLLGAFTSRLNVIQRQWAKMSLNEVFFAARMVVHILACRRRRCGALIIYVFSDRELSRARCSPDLRT